MSLRTNIARSIRPIVVSVLSFGAATIMVSQPASAADPVRGQAAYSSFGSGLIAVTLIQPVSPLRGLESPTSRNSQVVPVGRAPTPAAVPVALSLPAEYVGALVSVQQGEQVPALSAQLDLRAR